MPTVFRSGPYRLYFYSLDRAEPPHVHVQRDELVAKIWLDPPSLADNEGFSWRELTRILGLIRENADSLLKAWDDFFSD